MKELTVQEMSMICLYYAGTRQKTIDDLKGAVPFIDEPDTLAVVESAARKLESMSNTEFAAIGIDPDPLANMEPLG